MTNELKVALTLSVGMHAGFLIGLPVTRSVEFDVERAPTSVEIVVVAPPKAMVTVQPEPAPPQPEAVSVPVPEPPEPVPQTVVAPERRGVLTDLLPRYLRNPAPMYPREARERGWEGTVILEVEVLPSGRCGALRVLTPSGYPVLDEAALRAVRPWRFKPATRGSIPVSVWVEIPVTFRLIDALGGTP